MTPTSAERMELFTAFSRAFLSADIEALYKAVTPDFLWSYHDGISVTKALSGPSAIAEHFAEQKSLFSEQHFHEVGFDHLPERTFMTCRISETVRATGEHREQCAIELYTFKDGKIATKDVYRKRAEPTL
jgi:ketosteroid isomerase-like protein